MKTICNFIFIFALAGIFLYPLNTKTSAAEKPVIFVSILPQQYLAERIAGDKVDCEVMVQPGSSPATYEPSPRQMAKLSDAKAYFAIGVPFERAFLTKIQKTYPNLPVIMSQKSIPLRIMETEHQHEKNPHNSAEKKEPEEHQHHAGDKDPHVWLNPLYAKIIARNITTELVRILPADAAYFNANLGKLESDLDKLNTELKTALAPLKGKTLLVFHPAFGYFADAYSLQQEAIEVEGKSPSAKELGQLISEAKKDGIKVIFVQQQFSTKAATAVARAIGGAVVPIDPLAKDYIANLLNIAKIVKESLTK